MPLHTLLCESDTTVVPPKEGEVLCGNKAGAWQPRPLVAADIPAEVWDALTALRAQIAQLQELLTRPAAPERRR